VRAYRDDLPEPPVDLGDDLATVRNLGYFQVVGRLAHGVSFGAARAEMRVVAQRLAEARGDADGANQFVLVRLHDHVVGEVRPALLVLLGAVGFVLLIACANVANLLFARATVRQREVAVRAALGAGRRRLFRQLMTESLLLGIVGGALGLLLALWGVDVLVRLAPGDVPRLAEVRVDGWVLVFVLAISVVTSVAFGVWPALQGSSANLRGSLNESGRAATEGKHRRRLSAGLVVSEIALSLVLVCGAALLTKSLLLLQHADLGFRPDGLLVMRLALPDTRYTEEAQMEAFVRDVTERVQVLPSVISCGVALAHPFSGMAATLRFTIPGRVTEAGEETSADYQVVTPGYFETMGIPLLKGRDFGEADNADGPPVVVINEALARWEWPGEDPIGKRLAVGGGTSSEIVGVVGDVRHFGYDREPRPEIYAPYYQDPWPFMALLVRAEGDPRNLIGGIRQQVLAVDSEQPVYAVNTMDRVLAESLHTRRFLSHLLVLFAAVAIVLALVGIYGVISYTVNQRVHEIGIRMALGAQRGEVLRYILSWGFSLVLRGAVVGLLLAVAVGGSISGLLYGVGPADPSVLAGVTLLLIVAATAATYVPARRASRVDPLVALRHE
jgi:putative ABC transport system permease protein